jgi:hypothetical protein
MAAMAGFLNHTLWEELFFSDPNPYNVIFGNNISYIFALCIRRARVPKIEGHCENVVPEYTLKDFTTNFRMSKRIFDTVLEGIWDDLLVNHAGGREDVHPEKLLLMFIWYIVSQESMREISGQFDMSMSTVCTKFKKVNKAIIRRFHQVRPHFFLLHFIS